MKAKSQALYEELCQVVKNMNIEKCYYLAVMGMNRTLCLCPRFEKYNYFQDLALLYKFMEENMKEVFEHRQTYCGYNEVKRLFDDLSDCGDDIYYESEDAQETALKSGLYEFLEAWFAFLGAIKNSFEKYTPEKMVSFIALPIRYLDAYLMDCYYKHFENEQLQDFINRHTAIESEAKRILSDVKAVLNSDIDTLYERAYSYSKLNILEWDND